MEHARDLLGRTFTAHGVTVVLTEVEAYGGPDDPASHAYQRTPRSAIMYGPPWRLYVYRSYGIHYCANIVSGPRVGVRRAADRPWRLWIDGEPSVSAYRAHPRARGTA